MTADALAEQLSAHVRDARVLDAIRRVPRDVFVPPAERAQAWRNVPLPIGEGQTISQPLVVARMCELLELGGGERVLDVGTGSGYHAAMLAALARHVYSVEVREALAVTAAAALARAGVANVTLATGDGLAGLPDEAPFDAVNVAAAGALERLDVVAAQLAPGGRLVAPVQEGREQHLVVLLRERDGRLRSTHHEPVRFLPLAG